MGSIPLPALDVKPPQQQPGPLEQYGQLLQLKNAMVNGPLQTQQLQGQVQEQQQNLAGRQALNAAFANSMSKDANGKATFDPDKLQQNLANGPAAYQIPAVMKNVVDFQKSSVDLQNSKADLQGKLTDMLGSAAAAVKAAGYDRNVAHGLLDTLPSNPQIDALRQQIDNPQTLKQLVDTAIANSPAQQKLQNAKDVANIRMNTPDAQQLNSWLAANPGKTPADYQQFKVDQGVTADIQKQTNPAVIRAAAVKAGAEESARMPGEMALAAQRQALSQGDPRAAGQLLVDGDATLAELKARGSTPDFIAKTLYAAKQLSGGKYNAQSADAQFQVAKSPANVAFFGSAKSLTDPGGTLDQLSKVGQTLPANQIPVFNTLADWEKAATGNGPIAHYAATALGVADDYAKVMGGGQGSDTSRLQALNIIKANASPEARAGAVQGVRNSVQSQVASRIGKNPVLQRMYGDIVQPSAPAASASPAGATMRVPGSDGKLHWSDGKNDLGVAQ